MGIGNWGILSDEWWMMKIEWEVMSDEKKKKKKQKSPKYLLYKNIVQILCYNKHNMGIYIEG